MSTTHGSSVNHKHLCYSDHRSVSKTANCHRPSSRSQGVTTTAKNNWTPLTFNSRGKLPYGIHSISLAEFIEQFAYNPKRKYLLRGLIRAIRLLRRAGCRAIYIGGSYVSSKQKPNDIDVVWESKGMDWERVKRVAPVFLDKRIGSDGQKERFGCEFYPSECTEKISKLPFLEFFQCDYEKGRRRGLVRIDIFDF